MKEKEDSMSYILKTEELTKTYSNKNAVDHLSIQINKGDIYGLIGRNGAGKTTLMRLVLGLAHKTSGSIYLFEGEESYPSENKNRIGSLIENATFYSNLTARQNLRYYQLAKGITDSKEIDRALKLVRMNETGKVKFKNFSLGMKQRLGIALAILNHPDFVILDEPINGLDPIGISEIRDIIKELNEKYGMTILVSSHILSELYLVATRFCFIEKGKLIKEISKEELELECNNCLSLRVDDVEKATITIEEELKTKNYTVVDHKEIRLYDYLKEPERVNEVLLKAGIKIYGLWEFGTSLEDYFKDLLKEEEKHD